jgi:hypothetical protein
MMGTAPNIIVCGEAGKRLAPTVRGPQVLDTGCVVELLMIKLMII